MRLFTARNFQADHNGGENHRCAHAQQEDDNRSDGHRVIHIRKPCVAQEGGVNKKYGTDAVRSYGSHALEVDPASNLVRRILVGNSGNGASHLRRPAGLALLALALSACATQPLVTPCITKQDYERLKAAEPPKVHSKLTGRADEDVRPLAGSALELRSWGETLLDTLRVCSTPK